MIWFSVADGIIVVSDIESPKPPGPGENDFVHRLSDFMYLVHSNLCGPSDPDCLGKLSWVVHQGITNPESEAMAEAAMGGAGAPSTRWPGQAFCPGSDSFNALVGCPNGRGVAYLLSQHLVQYGRKTIGEVHVFNGNLGFLSMAWKIEPL